MSHISEQESITLVVVAFKRKRSLERLLQSLLLADYSGDSVRLVISIDKGDNDDVVEYAKGFQWTFGEKVVICHTENQGLRKHIIQCGELTRKYGSIIMLEDDLYVSKGFYKYTKQALEYYRTDEVIAGISLYSHKISIHDAKPFLPLEDGTDVFFLQMPSSWGQAWNKEQWAGFKAWYDETVNEVPKNAGFPDYLVGWPESSWLKYFIRYLVERKKYFVYPRVSLTTNFSDRGTHAPEDTDLFQVPILQGADKAYTFIRFDSSVCRYDYFFENVLLQDYFKEDINQSVTVDIYGNKRPSAFSRYVLSTKIMDHKVVKMFGLQMKPHEVNVFEGIQGNKVYLYDTAHKEPFPVKNQFKIAYHRMLYYSTNRSIKNSLRLVAGRFLKKFGRA